MHVAWSDGSSHKHTTPSPLSSSGPIQTVHSSEKQYWQEQFCIDRGKTCRYGLPNPSQGSKPAADPAEQDAKPGGDEVGQEQKQHKHLSAKQRKLLKKQVRVNGGQSVGIFGFLDMFIINEVFGCEI